MSSKIELPDWLKTILFIVLLVGTIVGVSLALIYVLTWGATQSFAGQKYDVTVTVQAVERSTRFGDHTNVWVRTYGGGDEGTGIVYTFIGFHNFTVGKDYHIVFVDEPYGIYFVAWYWEVRGRVQTIEEIS